MKYNNKKMQLQLAQCQKELRERDEFQIILPSLAARAKTVKRAVEGTEGKISDTSHRRRYLSGSI